MGIVNFGIPEEETDFLKNNMGLDIFVEGGTYKGATAKNMSEKFNKVFTIEKSDVMFDLAKENLKNNKNIVMLKGDTREHLRNILEENDNILFWLDAHWSGGDTYGEVDECPLVEELEIIFEYDKNYVILIDDARLFLAPPPSPHKIDNWPSLTDISNIIPDTWEMIEFEDVFYLYNKDKIGQKFKLFLQELVTKKWVNYGVSIQPSFVKGLKIAVLGLMKGKLR
jgi:hypothetical protein